MASQWLAKVLSSLIATLLLSVPWTAHAQGTWRSPDAVYLQGGVGSDVGSLGLGVTWDMAWQRPTSWGLLTSHWDLSLGVWHGSRADDAGTRRTFIQIGITPVLRLWVQDSSRFFLEAGIGANLIGPRYQNGDKRFGTAFNFGDHVAVGWRFGPNGRDELTLRLQHFSNGGIKHPNPGENFVQLRYLRRLH